MKTEVNYSAEIQIPRISNVYFGTGGMESTFKVWTYGQPSEEAAKEVIRKVIQDLQKALEE